MSLFKRHLSLYLMILPVLIYFILFSVYPLILGGIISFQDFHIIGDRAFIGLQNYVEVLSDPSFWDVFWNTVLIGFGTLILGFIAPLVLALSLNEIFQTFFKKIAQMVIYIPHLFSWVIVGGIWIYLLAPDGGLVNEILKALGKGQIGFLTDGNLARVVMILVAVWKEMGFTCILYLAALAGINPALYESARIDGAGRWKQLVHVTLPQLVPTMKVILLLNFMGILRIFDQIYIMRNSITAPKVDVLMMYIYEKGITDFKMGIASAASVIVFLFTLTLTFLLRKLIRYDEE